MRVFGKVGKEYHLRRFLFSASTRLEQVSPARQPSSVTCFFSTKPNLWRLWYQVGKVTIQCWSWCPWNSILDTSPSSTMALPAHSRRKKLADIATVKAHSLLIFFLMYDNMISQSHNTERKEIGWVAHFVIPLQFAVRNAHTMNMGVSHLTTSLRCCTFSNSSNFHLYQYLWIWSQYQLWISQSVFLNDVWAMSQAPSSRTA